MKRHNLFIPSELWYSLQSLAQHKGESVASIVRRAIAAYLKKEVK